MEKKLTADLNVVANSNLEIESLNGDLNIIQKLDDEPNDVGGLTSAQLKAKFDEAGNTIKTYINDTLIPAILADDATEAAREAAEQERVTAEQGRVSAEEARVAAETARDSAETVRQSAETARSGAESTRQSKEAARQAAETARANAETERQAAENSRVEAESQRAAAEQARADENTGIVAQATAQAAAAAGSAQTAESWAVGGTGTREGENTNNAKYWAEQAQAVVGGDFATKTEAQGYVADHNQSATAHSDIREAVSKAAKVFIIDATLAGGTLSGITATSDEILAAIEAEKDIKLRLSVSDGEPTLRELPYVDKTTSHLLNMEIFQFGGTANGICIGATLPYSKAGLQKTFYSESKIVACSNDTPAAPGVADHGNSDEAARADHVHPSETLRVTVTGDVDGNYTASATAAEIYAAWRAGKRVYAESANVEYSFFTAVTNSAGGLERVIFQVFWEINKREEYLIIEGTGNIRFDNSNDIVIVNDDGKIPSWYLPEISSVKTYIAAIGTTWTEDSTTGVKTQSVAIPGVLSTHTATVDHAYTGSGTSEDYAAFVEAENQYLNCITNGYAETYNGGIKFTIFGDANTVSIPIVVVVM